MIGVVDETSPEVDGAVLYSVVSALLVADVAEARVALSKVLPDRKRPFHWHREGPGARSAMVECIEDVGVVASAVVVSCGRKGQERARRLGLDVTLDGLVREGCTDLIIESRSAAQDGRDKAVILDYLRTTGQPGAVTYRWVEKSEPLVWVADAIGGAVHEHLTGRNLPWFARVQGAASLSLEYRRL